MTAPGSNKLIFTILFHDHSPERFEALRQRRFKELFSSPRARERFRDAYVGGFPPFHRYNDVAGYAELYWDGEERLLAEFYFRGNRTRKYGKAVTESMQWKEMVSSHRFYPMQVLYLEAGSVSKYAKESENRQAILESLEWLSAQATKLGCFIDLTHEKTLLDAIDVNKLFSP